MQWSDVTRAPTGRILRQFAVLWIVFWIGVAAWQYAGHRSVATSVACLAAALTVGTAGLMNPRLLRPVYQGWMALAFPIGWTVSRLALAVVFYVVLTPIGLAFRLIGRDRLDRRPGSDRSSFWQRKPSSGLRSYFRQF